MTDLVTLRVEERDGLVIAHISGELDLAGASQTGEEITAAVPTSARGLIVDCSELEFIDSSGVAMLFGLTRLLDSRRQKVRVVAPPGGAVTRVLEIVEFERAGGIDAELDAAIAGFPS